MSAGRRFVVLDRDGTLIVERHYLADPAEVALLPGAAAALRALRAAGLGLVVVTNQSGIARGLFDEARLALIHGRLDALLAAEGLALDGLYVCPHQPGDGCRCRKPATGLLDRAAAELGFDARRAFVVGDKECDVELGRRAGATTLLVRTGHGATAAGGADHVVEDLGAAAAVITRLCAAGGTSMPSPEERARAHLLASAELKREVAAAPGPVVAAADLIARALAQGGKLLLCGNGGSAADCQHLAAELVNRSRAGYARPALPAIALTTDTSFLTAYANDCGFAGVFARQVEALG
ncbi:MAG TPA: HAD-IIIA family hydrolase, partial [Polyangia bacterium]